MADSRQVVSRDYPYLSVRADARGHQFSGSALLDTGFTGHSALPTNQLSGFLGTPDGVENWELADGSVVSAPFYFGTVHIVDFPPVPAILIFLGDEFVSRRVIDRFKVTFDHGQEVVVEA